MTNRPQTVLFFDVSGRGGGSNLSLRELVDHLDPARYRAVLAFPDEPHPRIWGSRTSERAVIRGLDNYDFCPASWSVRWIYAFLRWMLHTPLDLLAAFRLLRRVRPDLVHINGGQPLWLGWVAHRLGLHVVWHMRELLARNTLGRWQGRCYARWSARQVAISKAVARRLPTTSACSVIYNPVSAQPADPEAVANFRNHFELEGKLALLVLGTPSRVKGHAFLAEVAHRLADHARVVFLLAGEFTDPPVGGWHRLLRLVYRTLHSTGGEKAELRKAWEPSMRSGQTILTGWVEPAVALAACDAVLCPNITTEPFGRTVIEAYAQGKPALVSDLEAFDETVEHGVTGWRLPLDADAWAKQIRALADRRIEPGEGPDALHLRASRFSARDHAERIMKLYDQMGSPQTAGDS